MSNAESLVKAIANGAIGRSEIRNVAFKIESDGRIESLENDIKAIKSFQESVSHALYSLATLNADADGTCSRAEHINSQRP